MRGKKYIISIVLAAAGLVGFVVALCFVFFGPHELNDYYFTESDSRIVSSMDNPSEKLMHGALKAHRVYEVAGDKIKSYKVYYVYDNAGAASAKLEEFKRESLEEPSVESVSQEGKYIIVTMKESTYKDSKPSEIRALMRRLESDTHVDANIPLDSGDETEPQIEYWEPDEE